MQLYCCQGFVPWSLLHVDVDGAVRPPDPDPTHLLEAGAAGAEDEEGEEWAGAAEDSGGRRDRSRLVALVSPV